MSATRFFSAKNILRFSVAVCIIQLASCGVVPKNYPTKKPFVFKYNVTVEGNVTAEQKSELISRLSGQLDDSIRVRTARKFIYKGINRPVLNRPPVYNKDNADKSVVFMKALLRSMGYFKDTINYKAIIDTVGVDQYRTSLTFNVKPGKVISIDSFGYNIKQQELQNIALANQKDALVKKGDPFAKAAISSELDRLVDIYRNSGYLRFGREVLIGLWDTLDVSLLRPVFDPLEQIEILQKLKEQRENPKADLEIRLKPGFDSSKLTKYFVGNITAYPEFGPDTIGYKQQIDIVDGIKIIYYQRLFKPKILPQNIYFRHGDLYNLKKYLKTVNRINSLGSWRLVNIEPTVRKGTDTADFILRLTPARKYSFTANVEGSRNTSAVSGNLFGVGVNVGLQNRNFRKAATVANTNVRYGIEISDSSFIQTQQFVVSHNIYFPRMVPNFGRILPRFKEKTIETFKTVLSFNAGNTVRKDLFNLTTGNVSFGYEFQVKNKFYSLRLFNIEYSYLNPAQKLIDLFTNNPSLKNIFTDGLIASTIGGVTINQARKKIFSTYRANIEVAGLLAGLFHTKFLDDNLYRFIKIDAEAIRKINLTKRKALVLRLFGGVGYELNSTANPLKRNNLPFFKQYFAGGPNSMRAWGLRRLGPGSTVKNFKDSLNRVPERYGDVQLEANIEYRFPAFTVSGVKVDGALFTDIGNVWFLKKEAAPGDPDPVFNFNKLAKDLAVGIGGGLRVDFSFFVIRLDYSYKAKDPSPSVTNQAVRNKWFGYKLQDGNQFQLGISYPFIL